MDTWIDDFGKLPNKEAADKDPTNAKKRQNVNHDTDKVDHGKNPAEDRDKLGKNSNDNNDKLGKNSNDDNDKLGKNSNDDNVDKDPAIGAVGNKTASENDKTLENLDNDQVLGKAKLEQVMQNIANKTSTFARALEKVGDSMIPKAEDVALSLKNRREFKEELKALSQNVPEKNEKLADKKPVDDTEWLSPWITAHLMKANAFKAKQASGAE